MQKKYYLLFKFLHLFIMTQKLRFLVTKIKYHITNCKNKPNRDNFTCCHFFPFISYLLSPFFLIPSSTRSLAYFFICIFHTLACMHLPHVHLRFFLLLFVSKPKIHFLFLSLRLFLFARYKIKDIFILFLDSKII